MTNAFRTSGALFGLVCVMGCSPKPVRHADNAGRDPKVQFTVNLPNGRYAGTMNGTGVIHAQPQRGSATDVNPSTLQEITLTVAPEDKQQIGRLRLTRIKVGMMGFGADTNTPLPSDKPKDPWGPGGRLVPDGSQLFPEDNQQAKVNLTLRKGLGELIGPEMAWVIAPDGEVRTVVENEFATAIKNPQMAQNMQQMTPEIMAECFYAHYPDHPIGVGAIWHFAATRPLSGSSAKVPMEFEYELKDLRDSATGKIAVIHLYSHAVCTGLNAQVTGGAIIKDADVTTEGDLRIDVKTGLIVQGHTTSTGSMNEDFHGQAVTATLDLQSDSSAEAMP